jgi:oligopeptide/dipeptide ABC transporter ATP-binding protein
MSGEPTTAGKRVAAETSGPILSVRNLVIEVPTAQGATRLVDGASFDVHPHEVFGIVGESGSGKSVTMLAVMGLLPHPVYLASGEVLLRGERLTSFSFEQMRQVRGKKISMIFQDPMTSLNPVLRVGTQIAEAISLHNRSMSKAQVKERVIELLDLVGIPDPRRRAGQFPNEFSGGMRQRAMIAMAIANEPDLLIADEPTTALDVTIQAQVMDVLASVRERTGAAMVLITHDLGLVAEVADRVTVMYGGRMMEQSRVTTTFSEPLHPYTLGLIASLPRIDRDLGELYSIPGQVPDSSKRPSGCVFHPRCGLSNDRAPCRQSVPALRQLAPQHLVACHFAEETLAWARAEALKLEAVQRHQVTASAVAGVASEPALKVDRLSKDFRVRRSRGFGVDRLQAVSDISFALQKGRTLGLVGESGCGKSTLGRVILNLLQPTAGAVWLRGDKISHLKPRLLRDKRRELQVVFQNPYASLDPRMTIHEIIAEPLRINGRYAPERITELLSQVGLSHEAAKRRPPEFSGGQRQRIAIARALALGPEVVILDEAVSALDVSIQAQVVNLLKNLQKELGLTYLFISHDLSVVRHISDEVAVMYLGRFVEYGPRERVFSAPAHPYTQALLSAVPKPTSAPARQESRIILVGDLPNPISPPSGCPFRTRCFKATVRCAEESPDLTPRTAPNHLAACHYATDGFEQRPADKSILRA